jgi:hypothetical protein
VSYFTFTPGFVTYQKPTTSTGISSTANTPGDAAVDVNLKDPVLELNDGYDPSACGY